MRGRDRFGSCACCGPQECKSYFYDFDDGSAEIPPEWTVLGGAWSIENLGYPRHGVLSVDSGGGIIEFTGGELTDTTEPMSAGLVRFMVDSSLETNTPETGVSVRVLFNFEDADNYYFYERLYRDPNAAGDTRAYLKLGKRVGGVDEVLAIKDKGAGSLFAWSLLYYGEWEYAGRGAPTLVVEADRVQGGWAGNFTPELAAEVDALPTNNRVAIQVLPGAGMNFDQITVWRRRGKSRAGCAYGDFSCGYNNDISQGAWSPDLGAPWPCRADGAPENLEWEYHRGSLCAGAETPHSIAVCKRGTWNNGPEISMSLERLYPYNVGNDYRFFFHYQNVDNWEAMEYFAAAGELRLLKKVAGVESIVDRVTPAGYPHVSPWFSDFCAANGRVRGSFGGAGFEFVNYTPAFESGLVGVGYGANVVDTNYKPSIVSYNRACGGCLQGPVWKCLGDSLDGVKQLQLTVPPGSLYPNGNYNYYGEEGAYECPDCASLAGVFLLDWTGFGEIWESPRFTLCDVETRWRFTLEPNYGNLRLYGVGTLWRHQFPHGGQVDCASLFPIRYQGAPAAPDFAPAVPCFMDESVLVLEPVA